MHQVVQNHCHTLENAFGYVQHLDLPKDKAKVSQQARDRNRQPAPECRTMNSPASSPRSHQAPKTTTPHRQCFHFNFPLSEYHQKRWKRSFTQLSLARSCCTKQPLRCNRIKKLAGQSPQKMKPKSHAYVKELWIMNTEAPAGIETKAKANEKNILNLPTHFMPLPLNQIHKNYLNMFPKSVKGKTKATWFWATFVSKEKGKVEK